MSCVCIHECHDACRNDVTVPGTAPAPPRARGSSTATIYWEGEVRLVPEQGATPPGKGYLELTGYWRPMRL